MKIRVTSKTLKFTIIIILRNIYPLYIAFKKNLGNKSLTKESKKKINRILHKKKIIWILFDFLFQYFFKVARVSCSQCMLQLDEVIYRNKSEPRLFQFCFIFFLLPDNRSLPSRCRIKLQKHHKSKNQSQKQNTSGTFLFKGKINKS